MGGNKKYTEKKKREWIQLEVVCDTPGCEDRSFLCGFRNADYRKTSAENKSDIALLSDSTNADLVPACEVNADRISHEITSNGLNNTPQNGSSVIV
ncbi:hypothetical protein GJ496_006172 [Pomphorhynchus laevis]|nr:hypothetical protein GJ496_006172 [Pomphorhynchus laevis]